MIQSLLVSIPWLAIVPAWTWSMSLVQAIYDLYGFMILYLLLFVVTGSWFVLDGVLATVFCTIK